MVLEINKKIAIFNLKQIWFADSPFDVDGASRVIFKDCKKEFDCAGFTRHKMTTLIIDLTQDLDKIWKDMDKSSCRYMIKRGEKEGVVVRISKDPKDFKEFNKINNNLRKLKGLSGGEGMEEYRKVGILFMAGYKGEILGGQLYIFDKNNFRLISAASKRLQVDNKKSVIVGSANRMILWEAIKYAKTIGTQEFDLGGYYMGTKKDEQKEKLNSFKESFGGRIAVRYDYLKDYSKIYKFLSLLKQKIFSR